MRADPPRMLTRRQAFAGATLTFTAVWTTLAIPTGAAAQPVLAWTPKALTADQARVLDAVAELIMPTTDTPGAREAGVPQFIDRAVAGFCEPAEAALIRAGLDRADADARAAHGGAFVALSARQQVALLERYDAEATAARRTSPPTPHFFSVLKELTTVGYFTSQPGATVALRYDPVPGDYRACVPLKEIGRAWAT